MRKAYIYLLPFILWSVFFWWHYVYNIKQLGASTPKQVTTTAVAKPIITSATSFPKKLQLLFKPSTYGLIVQAGNSALIDSILAKGQDGQLLQITGLNSPAEQMGLDYELGIARAAELKKLLINRLPEDRIEIYSDTSSFLTYTTDSLVEAVFYEWVDGYTPDEELDYYTVNHPNKRIKTEDFEELFDKLATRLIATGEKVILKGHTDSYGDSELNFTIALRNAKDIRDVLKEKGVPREQIETTSRGEDEPVGDNTTDLGKLDNRRIEIDIREE